MIDVPASYLAIIVILLLMGCGLPLPEELVVVAAGVLAAHGNLNPWLALASCMFGAFAGDCLMYCLGYHFGRGVLQQRHWFARFVTPEREAKIEELFRRHGLKVFFLARFLVVVRSPLLWAAGIMRVPFWRFLLIDLFSAVVVVGVFFGLSYQFGDVYKRIRDAEVLLTVVAAVVLAVTVFFLWRRHRRRLASGRPKLPEATPPEPDQSDKPRDRVEEAVYNRDAAPKPLAPRTPRHKCRR